VRRIGTLVACCLALCAWAGAVLAEMNLDEVKSFRLLVPDYSKTSGGISPALSPDGNTLAYVSNDTWEVWIIQGIKDHTGRLSEPWKLDYRYTGARRHHVFDPHALSYLDWSPDSKRLAIAVTSGPVYVAQNFKNKAAEVKALGPDPASDDGMLNSPRWSPDGKRLLVARSYVSAPSQAYGAVSVMDVESGAEAIIARDAITGGEAWTQPWSPDGKSMVYTSIVSGKPGESIKTDIWVADVDTGAKTRITKDGHSSCPGWSPKSDLVTFLSRKSVLINPLDSESACETDAVWTADIRGGKRKPALTYDSAWAQYATARRAEEEKGAREGFEQEFRLILSAEQLSRLRQGLMSIQEMRKIAALYAAREIDGDLQRFVESHIEEIISRSQDKVGDLLKKGIPQVSEDARRWFVSKCGDFQSVFFIHNLFGFMGANDRSPVWSPDGKRIAFVRKYEVNQGNKLFVADLRAGRMREIADACDIANVSWTADGKSLVVQSKRSVAFETDNVLASSTPGYPEIWLLDLTLGGKR